MSRIAEGRHEGREALGLQRKRVERHKDQVTAKAGFLLNTGYCHCACIPEGISIFFVHVECKPPVARS